MTHNFERSVRVRGMLKTFFPTACPNKTQTRYRLWISLRNFSVFPPFQRESRRVIKYSTAQHLIGRVAIRTESNLDGNKWNWSWTHLESSLIVKPFFGAFSLDFLNDSNRFVGAWATPINLLHYCSTSSSHSHSHNLHAEKWKLQIFGQATKRTRDGTKADRKRPTSNELTSNHNEKIIKLKLNVMFAIILSPYPPKTGRLLCANEEETELALMGWNKESV